MPEVLVRVLGLFPFRVVAFCRMPTSFYPSPHFARSWQDLPLRTSEAVPACMLFFLVILMLMLMLMLKCIRSL